MSDGDYIEIDLGANEADGEREDQQWQSREAVKRTVAPRQRMTREDARDGTMWLGGLAGAVAFPLATIGAVAFAPEHAVKIVTAGAAGTLTSLGAAFTGLANSWSRAW